MKDETYKNLRASFAVIGIVFSLFIIIFGIATGLNNIKNGVDKYIDNRVKASIPETVDKSAQCNITKGFTDNDTLLYRSFNCGSHVSVFPENIMKQISYTCTSWFYASDGVLNGNHVRVSTSGPPKCKFDYRFN